MLVSLIVPHYNDIGGLRNLLSSVPDVSGLEVLVCDDHSLNFPDIEVHHKKTMVKIFRNEDGNKYAGTARNHALSLAVGEYVYFSDSDDLLITENFLGVFMRLRATEADIVYTLLDSDGIKTRYGLPRHDAYNQLLLKVYRDTTNRDVLVRHVVPCGKFIKREIITKNNLRFDPTKYANDIVFGARLYFTNPVFEIITTPTYFINSGKSGLTTNRTEENIRCRINQTIKYNQILKNNECSNQEVPIVRLVIDLILIARFRAVREVFQLLRDPTLKVFPSISAILVYLTRVFKQRQGS